MTRRKKIEIWFQDEARIGQKNGFVRQWARRGTRPIQPADQRYERADLFGAACDAWRKFIAQPNTITSIGMRTWAHEGHL